MGKKLLFLQFIISLFIISSIALAELEDDPNLVARWLFDDDFTEEVAGRDANYVGGDPCWTDGVQGKALWMPDSMAVWIDGGGSWGRDTGSGWVDFDENNPDTYPASWNPNDANTWDYNDVYTWADFNRSMTVSVWVNIADPANRWEMIVSKIKTTWNSGDDSSWGMGKSNLEYEPSDDSYYHFKFSIKSAVGERENPELHNNKNAGNWGYEIADGQWHQLVGVFDNTNGIVYRYIDGMPNVIISDASREPGYHDPYMGIYRTNSDIIMGRFRGKMDEVRVFNRALSAREVKALYGLISLYQAWDAVPEDNGVKDPIAPLVFKAGDKTSANDRQEVFLSDTFEDVNSASASDPIGAVRLDPNLIIGPDGDGNYSIDSAALGLSLGNTYYWRVDDYNAVEPNMWKGNVWQFQVAPYYIIDDFESYGNDNELKAVWSGEGAGFIYLEGDGTTETITIDELSLHITNFFGSYGGASIAPPLPQTDWSEATGIGVKSLWVSFYGISTNPAAPIYAYIEDGSNGYYVHHPDPNAAKAEQWKLWRVDLKDFTDQGLDLSNITNLAVGVGDRSGSGTGIFADVYFDDVRVYVPVCVPELRKPLADVGDYGEDSDCAVDNKDLAILGRDWLKYSYSATSVVPSNDDLELYYSFTGDDLQDDSGNSRDGQARNALKDPADTNYYQTTTALYEDGPSGFGRCLVFTNAPDADDPNGRFYVHCGGERAAVPAFDKIETEIGKWPDPDGDPNFWPVRSDAGAWPNAWQPVNDANQWPDPDWVENYDPGDPNTWPDYDPSDPCTVPGVADYKAPTDANFNDADWPDGWDIATPSTWWNPADANTYWDPEDFYNWADFDEGLTLSCWVKLTEPYGDESAKNKFIAKGWPGAWSLSRRGSDLLDANEGQFTINKNEMYSKQITMDEDLWYHIAGTFDGQERRIYVDGVLGDIKFIQGAIANPEVTDPIRLGTRGEQLDYAGFLDEVRVYSRALSHGEIMNLAGMAPGTVMQVELPQPGLDLSADGMINFKDYAVLMQEWLVGPLKWPTW